MPSKQLAFYDPQVLKMIPRDIWMLSLANFLINVATIITFSYTPLFLVAVFGLSISQFGRLEGIAEGTSWVMRIFSGMLSDYFKKRKLLVLIGYGLIFLSRPLFIFAHSVFWVFSGRMVDRIANGLQASPREALTADLSPEGLKGACFGVRQALGWIGSVVGALIGISVMYCSDNNFSLVFLVGAIPAVLAFSVIAFYVKDVPKPDSSKTHSFQAEDFRKFSGGFWILIGVSFIYMFGRFSESFIVLWAKDCGLSIAYAPYVNVFFNIACALASYPVGVWSDRMDRRYLIAFGLVMMVLADGIFFYATDYTTVLIGASVWGLQVGITQSLLVTMVADRAPKELRGTAFGIYFFCSAIAMFCASTLAGHLAEFYGHTSTFVASGVFGILAFVGILFIPSSGAKERIQMPSAPSKQSTPAK